MSILGPLISGAASLIGGLFGKSSSEKAAQKNYDAQKEFAQNSIQWKVADANAAGIHPVYAMGASPVSFSPSFTGDTALAAGIGDMGQNIGRAVDVSKSSNGKVNTFERSVQGLTLQKMQLENDKLASELRLLNQPGTPPTYPGGATVIDGQGSTFVSPGLTVRSDPRNTPAQDWENQYGEIGGEIGGLSQLVQDALKHYTGASGPAELGSNIRKWLLSNPRYLPADYGRPYDSSRGTFQ